MRPPMTNTRLKLPTSLYKELRHIAIERCVPVCALLSAAAEQMVRAAKVTERQATTKA